MPAISNQLCSKRQVARSALSKPSMDIDFIGLDSDTVHEPLTRLPVPPNAKPACDIVAAGSMRKFTGDKAAFPARARRSIFRDDQLQRWISRPQARGTAAAGSDVMR